MRAARLAQADRFFAEIGFFADLAGFLVFLVEAIRLYLNALSGDYSLVRKTALESQLGQTASINSPSWSKTELQPEHFILITFFGSSLGFGGRPRRWGCASYKVWSIWTSKTAP